MGKCSMCQKEKTLNNLEAQTDEGETYTIRLCDTCWDAIFAIAKVAARSVVFQLVNQESIKKGFGSE